MTQTAAAGAGRRNRIALALLGLLLATCVATVASPPAGRLSWALEVGPGLVLVAILAALHRRLPLSTLVHVAVFLHVLVLVYGGYWTYSETPLGNWAKAAFSLERNHYDRVGHFALGFFPALLVRELLLRCTPLVRGRWLTFLVLSVVLAVGAAWEILEWWTSLVVAPDVGNAYLGTQGDPWDAHWDMLLAVVGAVTSLALLSRVHDRSMADVSIQAY